MTKLLALAFAAVLISGCASTSTNPEAHAKQCQYYTAIYEAYVLARENGNASEAEILSAKVASVFLTIHCGYVVPGAPAGTKGVSQAPLDQNMVPIIDAPK
jgi:uncharacterized protein YceK